MRSNLRFYVAVLLSHIGNIALAEPIRFQCENWHPRMGQMEDASFLIDPQQKICNGQKCEVTDGEFKWTEQGGRYEFSINRQSGEGYVYFSASSEKTALLKNCRSVAK